MPPFDPIDLDAETTAAIAAGMRRVAEADGDVHYRELALIEGLAGDLPHPAAAATVIRTAEAQAAYVTSLAYVAMADGGVSDVEHAVIVALAAEVGVGKDEVEATILAVKREMLATFAGVEVFRDEALAIAAELGLGAEDLDAAE